MKTTHLYLYRMLIPLLLFLTTMIGMDCKVTESVVFHSGDQIYNSISLWIITTAIDFFPCKDALFSINQYALNVKQSLISYSGSLHNSDPRYSLIMNITIDDINSVLHEIFTYTQNLTFNLTYHIINPDILEPKSAYYLLVDCSISCLELQMMMILGQ